MILVWELDGNYLTCVKNNDDSIRLFKYTEAEEYKKKMTTLHHREIINAFAVK